MTRTRSTLIGRRERGGGARAGTPVATARKHGARRALFAGSLAIVSATGGILVAETATAAVPNAPDNLLVFPNRDFVTVEGFMDHMGETATLEVTRPGVGLIGSSQGLVSGDAVAFEVNHPGGYCWGNGTNLKVTPDLLPHDVVSIRFPSTPAGETAGDVRIQDGFVTGDAVQTGATVTVTGHVGAGVDPANTEQRIVEPALTATIIGRRDIRAIPGPLVPAPKGGYSSGLEFNGDTFTATYLFDDPDGDGPQTGADLAKIAANASLGERLLSWEMTDAAGNRQGVTIAEFGEPGGPGVGGCPNGPLQSGPPGPTDVTAANVNGDIKLTWSPAVAIPGTQPITGYRVHAIAQTSTGGEQVEIGKRIAGQSATGTTLTGLSPTETYDVEVVAVSSVGETFPAVHATPQTDTTPPTVIASPTGSTFAVPQQVTLTANEPGSQIFFTTDGTAPVDATGILGATATAFTAPITISANTTLKFVAFDPTGNVSQTGEQVFTITNTPTPVAPTFGAPSVGPGTVTLNWTATDPSITGYGVQVYDPAGAAVGNLRRATGQTLTISDLPAEAPFFFTVKAQNANGFGPESTKLGPLSAQGAVVANAGPDQSVPRGTTAKTVSLTGAGSTPGATYQWTQVVTGPTDPDKVTLTGANTLSPSFSLRTYAYPMTNKPLTFLLAVTQGANTRTDDVLVTPVPDQVAFTSAKWKAGDFKIVGTGNLVGTTITVHRGSLGGPVLGRAAVTAAAPPGIGDFTLRLRDAAAGTSNPGTVWIESSAGGTAGPFTVSAG